jgi:hypothetical protein
MNFAKKYNRSMDYVYKRLDFLLKISNLREIYSIKPKTVFNQNKLLKS